ncbi:MULTISPECIES: alkaline phosphatase D family protein [Streptomyces]|uniref:alkaline phosphatase D family protein n=1 Tax=Streptomyces TaxID=1883 RepID=UPI00163B84C5|nr:MULTISPECIES: alkaline phosphatase D family protein [Streptomyces]MBC2877085.1 alkaline phosphatase D family protein [Streptomyces sp. TYQ1024]UBI39359.1 alkaline phosphatase D family protein [Streptomyces mobaraensis]UKW31939.1 alkaline phosphatase D family protein [Streptomyces sp. TYQ1024]
MNPRPPISRRAAVTGVAATAALLPLAVAPAARAATAATAAAHAETTSAPAFLHGVASGDPLPDGILLWTRVTPVPEAVPGSGLGPDVQVSWQVAEDAGFGRVTASGTVTASAAGDHTVKADVRGLRPGTDYFFRFTVTGGAGTGGSGEVHSPTGRTRTAPAPDAQADGLRFGVVSCANWESGHFSAYRHLAARRDLDAVLHLGDYLYEYKSGEYPAAKYVVRPHEPRHEIVTLADYRTRHGRYKTDPDLQALHAALPFVAIWDDHEFADNAWSGGAVNHTPGTEGAWADRVAAAKKAYFEWMPVRPSVEGTTYRRLRFGRLADLHLLDLRSFRSEQVKAGSGAVDAPSRTLTGRAQLDWLKDGLAASDTTWRLVGNPVMMSPLAFGAMPAHLLKPLAKLLGLPEEGIAANTDQWDGYTHDRRELLGHLTGHGINNTVFLTGDIHMAWANDVPETAATYPVSRSVATEFVVTSVTADNLDDTLHVLPHTVSLPAVAAIQAANRHVKWVDMDSHGYGVLDITAERAQMDYYVLSDKRDPKATSSWERSYRTLSGSQRVERVKAPVR